MHQVFGFYQKLKNSCLKLIEFSSTNRIFNHILTFVTLYGAALNSESNKLKIFILKKRASKVILDYNVDDSIEAMNSLKIMSIYDRLYLRKAKFMFKVYNSIAPAYISENFTLRNNENTNIQLRLSSAGCFIPPKPRTEYLKQSLRYSGCLIWNSLPEEVKNAQTISTFHNRCLRWQVN